MIRAASVEERKCTGVHPLRGWTLSPHLLGQRLGWTLSLTIHPLVILQGGRRPPTNFFFDLHPPPPGRKDRGGGSRRTFGPPRPLSVHPLIFLRLQQWPWSKRPQGLPDYLVQSWPATEGQGKTSIDILDLGSAEQIHFFVKIFRGKGMRQPYSLSGLVVVGLTHY